MPLTKKIGFIGLGNMAEALIRGLIGKKILSPSLVLGAEKNQTRQKFMAKKYKIRLQSSLKSLAQGSEVILLAVKPIDLPGVLGELKPYLTSRHLILSIAAGTPLAFLEKHLGKKQKIVRLMPNTPALVGLGATGFFANKNCSPADKKLVQTLFEAVGVCQSLSRESLIDSVTALSGSGPAYVFLFLKALIEGAEKLGLPSSLSQILATQTVMGAAELFKQSGEEASSLIAKVASKGGTTEAALLSFQKSNFEGGVAKAMKAAHARAQQMASRRP